MEYKIDKSLIGNNLSVAYTDNARQIYILIINGYPTKNLSVLSDVFKKRMMPILKVYHADLVVLNEEVALKRKIITSYKN